MEENELSFASYDELLRLNDRLYCAWQALLNGDDCIVDHNCKVGNELYQIWNKLDDILEEELANQHYVEEEMKKFEQGFAYVRPERNTSRRTQP